jgi:uncharacterized membrane protein
MANLIKKLLTKEDLAAIVAAIGKVEKNTSGEIRVSIRQKRRWREKKLNIEDIARREFHFLKMNKTKERTGVLIFLLLEDKKFYILADEGIHSKVEEGKWSKVAAEISAHFSQKNFKNGIIKGVEMVGEELSRHLPRKSGDKNELSNEVRVS